jgi:hypothetical protein
LSKVEVVVAATSTESGRFDPVERFIDVDDLLRLFDQLTGIGQGYLEVRSTEREFPLVMVGFRGGFAVMHCASTPDQTALLYGDGSVAAEATIEVPIMDELAIFTGEFVLNTVGARKALKDFVGSGDPASLGEWCDL